MSKYMIPNIQLFAEPASEGDENKKPDDHKAQNEESSASQESTLPKTQEELDALISARLKRAEKEWIRRQAKASTAEEVESAASQPPAAQVENTELLNARKSLLEANAQLEAYKSGVKPDAVEDAVLLAMHAAEKAGGELDSENIAEAMKEVLKRHPEWKSEEKTDTSKGGFRIGSGVQNDFNSPHETPALSAKKRWNRFN